MRSVRSPESPESSAKHRIYEITNRGSSGSLIDISIRRWGRLVQLVCHTPAPTRMLCDVSALALLNPKTSRFIG